MVTARTRYRDLPMRPHGRAALGTDGGPSFTAVHSPKPATELSGWAMRQFEDLERVLRAHAERLGELQAEIAALQADVAAQAAEIATMQDEIEALQGAVGNGTWDG